MADTVVHIGENSAQHVAFRLMERIASVEDKLLQRGSTGREKLADRKWILGTYAECFRVVCGNRPD